VHATDARGRTPLIHAILSVQYAPVRPLLRAGAARSEAELSEAREAARGELESARAALANGEDLARKLRRPTQQVVDDASCILELLEAARAPDSDRV
jgi:hypothetical protein